MLLEKKNAIIYGAGGAIGGRVARAFACEGAKLFLTGRTLAPVETLAKEISAAGGAVEITQVDALDQQAVEKHVGDVAEKAGGIDLSFNLISIPHIQGTALFDLALQDFTQPVTAYMTTHFITATAAARRMVEKGSGVILMMTTTPARMAIPLVGAFGVVCGAIEAFSHTLAAEVGSKGVRVACLLSSGSPETPGVREVFGLHAKARGLTAAEFQESLAKRTLMHRLTTLDDVAKVAAFIASDQASAITGTSVNLSCGSTVD